MEEQIDFTGDTVVITGGASWIASATGAEFAKEGANIVIADIDDEQGKEVAEEIADEHGADTLYQHTDVSEYESCQELVETSVDEFGSVDVLVNVAAIASPSATSKPFIKETPEDWKMQTDITLMGPINMTHAVLPEMMEQEEGAIINFCSEAYKGHDNRLAMYGAAKAGLASFTKTVSSEIAGDNIRINAVSPGTTRTEATDEWLDQYGDQIVQDIPLDRFGEPEDPAYAAVFLASDAASWITGQVLSVNGGYL